MPNTENADVHTVEVPDWLKHCFDDVYDTDAADYKKLAAVMKDKSFLHMTVADLLVAGAISVSPQSNSEIPPLEDCNAN